MNGLCARLLRCIQNSFDIQVGFGSRRRPYGIRFIRTLYMQSGAVYIRKDRNRRNAKLMARTNDADGNLTAIRNQDFLEHFHCSRETQHSNSYGKRKASRIREALNLGA
jgi:hypothetical protein